MQIATRRFFQPLLGCLLLLASGRVAAAQDGITISGTITTRADGLSVPAAVVSIVGADATATSDASGRYTLVVPRSIVKADHLQLKVDALGLRPTVIDVEVNAATLTVFDVFPDRNTTVNSFNGIQTFPSQSPFGMNGRTLYARIGWTF